MGEKTELQKLSEKILIKREPAGKEVNFNEADSFGERYKEFLGNHKTERETILYIKEEAEKKGYKDLTKNSVTNGGKYYYIVGEKNLALINFAGLKGLHAIASHADSPCIHLKPYPLVEHGKFALLKGHYYGGIKKYQWMNIPLALHGVIFANGKKVNLSIGEQESEPCFSIPDLLPHLSQDQMQEKPKNIIKGEQLNPIIASNPVDDKEVGEKIKLAAAKHLHDKYGIVEEDFISAELSFVPAGKPRDIGLDKSMIAGYGHDDRSSVYTSLQAMFDAKQGEVTQIVAFYDKEEIGSYGKSGATNLFFNTMIEELIDRSESDLRPSQVWENTKILSADVTAAIDPNFPETHDSTNSSHLGYGVAVEKYGGGGGKYSTNDADAEFIKALVDLLNNNKVPWQTGELGRIDLGGGGTIAMFLAKYGADVIDVGIPVLGMHAPYELAHKNDLYSAYLCYKVFLENKI